jgi:hypothetical protein
MRIRTIAVIGFHTAARCQTLPAASELLTVNALLNDATGSERGPMRCTFPGCEEKATFHVSRIQNRKCVEEQHWCEPHARENLAGSGSYLATDPAFAGKRCTFERAKQFEISYVIMSEMNDQQVVYLHEVDGPRVFPLLVGIFEAHAIDR